MKITDQQVRQYIEIRKRNYGEFLNSLEEARSQLEGVARIMNWLIKNGAKVTNTNRKEEPGVSGVACQNSSDKQQ